MNPVLARDEYETEASSNNFSAQQPLAHRQLNVFSELEEMNPQLLKTAAPIPTSTSGISTLSAPILPTFPPPQQQRPVSVSIPQNQNDFRTHQPHNTPTDTTPTIQSIDSQLSSTSLTPPEEKVTFSESISISETYLQQFISGKQFVLPRFSQLVDFLKTSYLDTNPHLSGQLHVMPSKGGLLFIVPSVTDRLYIEMNKTVGVAAQPTANTSITKMLGITTPTVPTTTLDVRKPERSLGTWDNARLFDWSGELGNIITLLHDEATAMILAAYQAIRRYSTRAINQSLAAADSKPFARAVRFICASMLAMGKKPSLLLYQYIFSVPQARDMFVGLNYLPCDIANYKQQPIDRIIRFEHVTVSDQTHLIPTDFIKWNFIDKTYARTGHSILITGDLSRTSVQPANLTVPTVTGHEFF